MSNEVAAVEQAVTPVQSAYLPQHRNPHSELSCKEDAAADARDSDVVAATSLESPKPDGAAAAEPRAGVLRRTADGWRVYLQQPVLPAALALALLYLTVMSLGVHLRP